MNTVPGHDGGHSSDKSPSHNQKLGARGEQLAASFLIEQGFRLIAQNWRCKYGELDLIMEDGETVVGVEVKTRSGMGYGAPLEAITARKAARLWRLLFEWNRTYGRHGTHLRVDAVGIVMGGRGSTPQINHLRAIS